MIAFYSDEIPSFFERPKNYHVRPPLLLTYPLNYAAARGDAASTLRLIELGVDVNSRGDMKETPLHEAISAGSALIVQSLLDAGASADLHDGFGKTPMDLAIASGNVELIEILQNHGQKSTFTSITEIAKIYTTEYDFSGEDWNINYPNEFGEFPIHIATRRRSTSEIKALIDAGCDINAQTVDEMKYSSLHYAAGIGSLDAIKLLLLHGIDYTLVDGLDRTAIDLIYLTGKPNSIFYINEWLKPKR